MEKINSLIDLYQNAVRALDNEWVYVNMDTWSWSPKTCDFYVIAESEVDALDDDEVYESDAGPYLPVTLRGLDLYPWMQLDTLKGVIANARFERDGFNEEKFIAAINYYRENDDFMEG